MSEINYLVRRNRIMLLVAKVLRRSHTPQKINEVFNTYRHSKITLYIENNFSDTIKKYDVLGKTHSKDEKEESIIWIFWWQGLENAPPLVRACIQSVIRNAKDYKVIIISQKTVHKYSDISEIIYAKLIEKKISLTHFSDILRFNLLKNHGGIWMDATIYTHHEIEKKVHIDFFTVSGFNDREFFNISRGKWTGFLIGGEKNQVLFSFMDEMFKKYWEKENELVDYFLIDYLLDIAYKKNIGSFRTYIKNNDNTQPNMFELQNRISDSWDEKEFIRLTEKTNFFKLSYKKKNRMSKDSSNTFYDYLIKRV
ncbi:capsular polysaccharide synthesis protein [Enterococcus malodoratus]|uniref:capsular polysaccharide synthesis protein n=1 Tax=Enterococcus malodoratus TaxID=71451 RepID=UPI0039B0F891